MQKQQQVKQKKKQQKQILAKADAKVAIREAKEETAVATTVVAKGKAKVATTVVARQQTADIKYAKADAKVNCWSKSNQHQTPE